ncbi:MAG TPA: uracil phosphoribosyltransferase [Phaeodactylibacter sp.]|nr:uracil phosphoribosyltransferase [Phaeodactylibacter sp.]
MYILSQTPSIANTFVAELRDINIQKDRLRFRRNLERIAEVLAYEVSKELEYEIREIETPLGIAQCSLLKDKVVLASILRAGLPMHQGILNIFDQADNAFVSAYRMHHKDGTFEINLQYTSCPDLTDSVLLLADPMLATGASMDVTIKSLARYGTPKKIHVITAIASSYGLEYIKRLHPEVKLWIGDLDEELTAKSYIVPGLGDAGDLAFGSKMQE